MKNSGHTQQSIANAIGKHKSVISRELSRELSRNCDQRNGNYCSGQAQRKYEARQQEKAKIVHFTASVEELVKSGLKCKLSPEQIVGRAKKEGKLCVSHERIYQYIWKDKKQGGDLHIHLRTQGKKYRKRGAAKDKRGRIVGRVDIEQRPAIVEERKRFGDFEIDTIIGKNHKGAILTINDRATGLLKMKKLEGKNAEALAVQAIALLRPYRAHLHTITADNGKEFAAHHKIAQQLGIQFYFAKPYHSWQRGSNENLNGLVRQYIPKQSNFDDCSHQYIQWGENELNNRPRKRLNFESPHQCLHRKVAFVG